MRNPVGKQNACGLRAVVEGLYEACMRFGRRGFDRERVIKEMEAGVMVQQRNCKK